MDNGDVQPGAVVRLVSRPEVTGAVIGLRGSGANTMVQVFHGAGTAQMYYPSQLELVPEPSGEQLSADELKNRLTALHVRHPSVSRLYSFNSGRIEYEPYQYRPVLKLINADRPRLLIADDVGVGKTIEAGLIIKELQARQQLDSVLVICPKPLVTESKWRNELKRFDEDFEHLDSRSLRHCLNETHAEGRWPSRYQKAILPYSLLDERLLLGREESRGVRPGLTTLVPPPRFDLVIVDEAHHVRNSDTWRHRAVKYFVDHSEAAVLISATPIQTGSDDLRTLLGLLRPDLFGDQRSFELMREPNSHLASAESALRSSTPGWQERAHASLTAAAGTTWGNRVISSDPRFDEAMLILGQDSATDLDRVRALRLAQSLNSFSSVINRTRRRDIGSLTVRKSETFEVEFTAEQQAVHTDLLALAGRIAQVRVPGQSLDFVLSTLQRQAASSLNGLAPFVEDLLNRRLSSEELSEADVEVDKLPVDLLNSFSNEIRDIGRRAGMLVKDPKRDRLLSYVEEKQGLSNNKLLVFSTFRHTLSYLQDGLESARVRVGLVHGGVLDDERRQLLARFALDKSEDDAIDVLLSSEVGTEGLDYQFCDALVNYDLPWNPMRIEQRIGRIDRRGQKSESVAIKNLVVRGTVDAVIYERCLSRIGVFQRALGGSEIILGELTREITKIGEDLQLTETERAQKLQQLADNKVGRMQEQEALEEREGALFGLPLKRLDDDGVEQVNSPWLSPARLAGLVKAYLRRSGYEQWEALFDRPVSLLRPSKQVRLALVQDYQRVASTRLSTWGHWLTDGASTSRRLTFDPTEAKGDSVELLSPVHELVQAAALAEEGFVAGSSFAVRATSDELPPDTYPVTLHAWTYLGVREDFELVITSSDDVVAEVLAGALPLVEDASDDGSGDFPNLGDRHRAHWVEARKAHVERVRALVDTRAASLEATHRARTDQLRDQLEQAAHANIRRMRESQLQSVEDDFVSRRAQLQAAVERSDLTATPLCTGTVEITRG